MTDWEAFKKIPERYIQLPGKKHAVMVTIMAQKPNGVMGNVAYIREQLVKLPSLSTIHTYATEGTPLKEADKLSDNVAQVELISDNEEELRLQIQYVLKLPWIIYPK